MASKPKFSKKLSPIDLVGESPSKAKNRIEVWAEWTIGPRTLAFDELWRHILADVLPSLDNSVIGATGEHGND